MVELYVNTDDEMRPGEVVVGEVWDKDKNYKTLALKCIREATKEEYLEFVKSQNLLHMVNRTIEDKKFYLLEILD